MSRIFDLFPGPEADPLGSLSRSSIALGMNAVSRLLRYVFRFWYGYSLQAQSRDCLDHPSHALSNIDRPASRKRYDSEHALVELHRDPLRTSEGGEALDKQLDLYETQSMRASVTNGIPPAEVSFSLFILRLATVLVRSCFLTCSTTN